MSYKDVLSYKYFRAGSAWIILLFGIGVYGLGYFVVSNEIWKEILIKIGDVLVIGVIIGYLSNAAQFLGIFKKDLEDIIYGKEFIEKRNDLEDIWERITKQMFKNKFPSIHKEFLNVITHYLPNDAVSYYHNYDIETTIEWENKESGKIKVTDDISFDLVADSDQRFEHPFKSWTVIQEVDDKASAMKSLVVDGKAPEIVKEHNYIDNECRCYETTIALAGSKRYSIRFSRERIYDLNKDFYLGFRARYIVNDLKVSLEHPEDIDVIFTCRGTQKEFENYKTPNKKRIAKRYKGIILPRQGYIFALNFKK